MHHDGSCGGASAAGIKWPAKATDGAGGLQCGTEQISIRLLLSQLLDQARRIFDLILPNIEVIGDRTGGVTMQTPKGLAKALGDLAVPHPRVVKAFRVAAGGAAHARAMATETPAG